MANEIVPGTGSAGGAIEDKKGYFELADKGTLFLDELQDMSVVMQRELLRVLQEGEILPVGAKRVVRVDVRVVAATNVNLRELVEQRRFRQDLFYRLNVVTVDLPPLRRRQEDMPQLVEVLLERVCERHGVPLPRLEQAALDRLTEHGWPGNIRELQNMLEKTLLLLDGSVIRERDLSFDELAESFDSGFDRYFERPYKDAKELFLRDYLRLCLDRNGGNVTRAATSAGLVRSSFHKMMRKHGLQGHESRRRSTERGQFDL